MGQQIVEIGVDLNVYAASKFAVRAISETLSNELKNTNIRVTVSKI